MGVKLKNKLYATWNEHDGFLIHYPVGTETNIDANYLLHILSRQVSDELTSRGYNMKTFRLEICPEIGNQKFVSERK